RMFAMQRATGGSVFKTLAFYAEPFWRDAGLAGESVSTTPPIELTLDVSPPSGAPGVIVCFAFGPYARAFTGTDPAERRRTVLDTLADRFGARARDPIDYHEHEWATERWTRGCSMYYMPPGALTQYGRALRAPVGRVHWAGTETATVAHGTVDGAIRSGERAA